MQLCTQASGFYPTAGQLDGCEVGRRNKCAVQDRELGYNCGATCLFSVPRLDIGQACCHDRLMNGIHLMAEMNGASEH